MKNIWKKALPVISLVLVAALALMAFAGCTSNEPAPAAADSGTSGTGASGSATSAAAEKTFGDPDSGSITVYTALEDELVTLYLEDFNAKYPNITVNVVRESTGIITAKLLAEKDNPQADVVWGTAASSLMILDDEGGLEPYAPTGVDKILPKFKSDKTVPTWVGIDVWETAFVINTVELEKLGLTVEDIQDYDDLLKPELKGHIVMPNPNSSGTGLLTVTGILQLDGKDTNAGWDYLTKLHENIDQYVHSGSKPAKMAGAGETVIGVSFGYAGITQKEKGAPVEIVFPKSGSGWDIEANALIKKDSINLAAETFLDWAISDSAMDMYKEEYPLICNGQGGRYAGFDTDPVNQLIDNDFSWVASHREEILNTWMSKFDGKSVAQ